MKEEYSVAVANSSERSVDLCRCVQREVFNGEDCVICVAKLDKTRMSDEWSLLSKIPAILEEQHFVRVPDHEPVVRFEFPEDLKVSVLRELARCVLSVCLKFGSINIKRIRFDQNVYFRSGAGDTKKENITKP